MAKILQPRHRQKIKKGLTLVEVVVSLAVISIVSIAVISVIISSTTQLANTSVVRFFDHELGEISNLYLSYDSSDYEDAIEFYTGKEYSDTYYYSASFSYVTSSDSYSYYVTLEYSEPGDPEKLTLTAHYSDNRVIMVREVSK